MKSVFRVSGLLVMSAALLFAGCAKRPQRPNPYDTMVGPAGGADMLNPQGGAFDSGETGIDPRSAGGTQDRVALQTSTVYFDYDSAAIKVSERAKVAQAADYLKANANARLLLEGHCDWRGTTEYNMGLGDRRAAAVRDYLGTLGIPAGRLETLSKGDLDARDGAADAEMQQDRRVDFVVVR